MLMILQHARTQQRLSKMEVVRTQLKSVAHAPFNHVSYLKYIMIYVNGISC